MRQKAKYEEVIDWIKEKIKVGEMAPGDKMYSENELVILFKMSRQTVRHAISILEYEGLVKRKRGSGTYIAAPVKELRKFEQTMRIAIVTTYIDEYIFPPIIKEIEKELSRAGYTLQLAFTNNSVEKERTILKGLIENDAVDGIIAETTKSALPNPNLSFFKQIVKKDIPIVFINSYYPQLNIPHISLNDKMAGKMVASQLVQCGHTRIAGLFKADDGQGHARYAGYVEALMEADIKVRNERIVWLDTEDIKDMKADESRILRRMKNCTACVCYNDEVANKLTAMCFDQDIKIPEDLSIISIDNSELATFCEVPLTSVDNPVKELGKQAAMKMLRMIAGEDDGENIELEPKLVVRNSVKIIS